MQAAQVFLSPQSTSAEIQKAGEQAMVILCNGKPNEPLNGLRYKRYNEKVATNVVHVQPQALPRLKQQENFTAFVCSTKFVSGWAAVMRSYRVVGKNKSS